MSAAETADSTPTRTVVAGRAGGEGAGSTFEAERPDDVTDNPVGESADGSGTSGDEDHKAISERDNKHPLSKRAFRLKIDTTEANLQKYFPDGPRTFPSKGRITLGSYAELNEAIAADFGMDEGERIYVKCYRNGSNGRSVYDPIETDDAMLFSSVPSFSMDVRIGSLAKFLPAANIFAMVSNTLEDAITQLDPHPMYSDESNDQRPRKGLGRMQCRGRREREPVPRCTLHPFSPLLVVWDAVQALQHLYADQELVATYVQMYPRSAQPQWFDPDERFDLWVDMLFVVDFLLQFRTAFFLHDLKQTLGAEPAAMHELGSDASHIAKYRIFGDQANGIPSTAFCVGLITSVPWDRIFSGAPYLRLLKCTSMERFSPVMPLFEVVLDRGVMIFPALKPITSLIFTVMVAAALCHTMSCFLYFAGHPRWEAIGDGSGNNLYACEDAGTCGWVVNTFTSDEAVWERYWTAFYYSFTIMATVGFGDISANNAVERILTMLAMFVGVVMYGVLLGSITSLVQRENLGVVRYNEKIAQMMQYLRGRGVSRDIRYRVKLYFSKMYPQQVFCDETTVLQWLPEQLRQSVRLDMYHEVISAMPFVPDHDQMEDEKIQAEWRVIQIALAEALVPLTFMRDEKVTYASMRSSAMHIIDHGAVKVVGNAHTTHGLQVDNLILVVRIDRLAMDRLRTRFAPLNDYALKYIAHHEHFQLDRTGQEDLDLRRVTTRGGLGLDRAIPWGHINEPRNPSTMSAYVSLSQNGELNLAPGVANPSPRQTDDLRLDYSSPAHSKTTAAAEDHSNLDKSLDNMPATFKPVLVKADDSDSMAAAMNEMQTAMRRMMQIQGAQERRLEHLTDMLEKLMDTVVKPGQR